MKVYVLNSKNYEGAVNLPVITTKILENRVDLEDYDGIVFTSKNAVYAIEKLNKNWKNLEIYSIGSGTSEAVREFEVEVKYEARSSYGDDFARELKQKAVGKKLLYLRPKVVISRVTDIIKEGGIEIDEVVIYETVCQNCQKLGTPAKNSVIIFSSPSTIECFFKCFKWCESYQAVVIGKNTASFMPQNIKYSLAREQNIPSCIELGHILSDFK